jgi:hypothetical protein
LAIFDHSTNCLITGVEVLEDMNRWIWIYCNWTKWKGYQIRLWIRWIGSIPRNKFIVCLIPNLLSICSRLRYLLAKTWTGQKYFTLNVSSSNPTELGYVLDAKDRLPPSNPPREYILSTCRKWYENEWGIKLC